jgi:1-acyl-sn-glycerol-3-phosphate acyltransferase
LNYLRAANNWGKAGVRAVGYGTLSLTCGVFPGGQRVSRWAMRNWCAGSADALHVNRTLRNANVLQAAPQCVLVANHLSTLDILVLGSFLERDYRWLAKAELFRVPFMGWHLSLAGHVPVYRGEARGRNGAIGDRIHQVVEEGASLLFFPEGSRSKDGRLKPFRMGAFMTAVTEELPVVPLVIRGTGDLMEAGAGDLSIDTTQSCSVTVLPPIAVPQGESAKWAAELLRDQTHAAFRRELEAT